MANKLLQQSSPTKVVLPNLHSNSRNLPAIKMKKSVPLAEQKYWNTFTKKQKSESKSPFKGSGQTDHQHAVRAQKVEIDNKHKETSKEQLNKLTKIIQKIG